jgi:hypothetical protein
MIKDYPEYKHIIEQNSKIAGEEILIYYQKMNNRSGSYFPEKMLNFLSAHEPYDGKVSTSRFMELHLNKYREFSENAVKMKDINIFECSYLQNQINELLGFHILDKVKIIQYLCKLAYIMKDLRPVLIYLSQPDVHRTIQKAADERRSQDKAKHPDWIDHVINYISSSPYGVKNKLQGFSGVVEFFTRRKEIELEAINNLGIKTIVIENPDYDAEKGIIHVNEVFTDMWGAL